MGKIGSAASEEKSLENVNGQMDRRMMDKKWSLYFILSIAQVS